MARSTRSTWRQASQPPGSPPPSNRRGLRLFGLCAFLLAGLGILAAWILYPKTMTAPAVRTIAVREYDARFLPPVAFAAQDSQILLQRFTGAKSDDFVNQMREQLDKLLRGLKQTKEERVVLHLCALSRAEGNKVYVLPGDANPDRPETWVDLAEVIEALKTCPAKHKLLILDVMRPLVDARLAVLEPTISRHVHAFLEAQGDLPFWILCACGKNERSLVSEELGQSVFAYFLDRGLSGAADGAGPEGKRDQRIMIKELASYAQSAVDRWAKSNRGLSQTPQLYGKDVDFPIAQFDASNPATPPAIEEKTYPAWLQEAWTQRDAWRRDGSYRLTPRLAFHLDATLVRAEDRWRAGKDEKRLKDEVDADMSMVKDQIVQARPVRPKNHPSLTTLLRLQGPPEDPKQQSAVEDAALAIRSVLSKVIEPGVKPEAVDKAKKEEFDKAYAEIKMKLPKLPPARTGWMLFDLAASTNNLTPGKLLLLEEWSRELSEASERRYVETVALERLRVLWKYCEENAWNWPAKEVHDWLDLVRDAEGAWAALAEMPGVVPWLKATIQEAENQRQKAEAALFDKYYLKWKEVGDLCKAAKGEYRKLVQNVDRVRAAQREWDEGMVQAPGFAAVLVGQRRVDAQEDTAWRGFVESLQALGERLATPDSAFFSATQADLAGQAESRRKELVRRLKDRHARSVRVQSDGTPADYWEVQALLLSPLWTADERVKLWQAGRTMALRLHKEQDKTVSQADLLNDQNETLRLRVIAFSTDLLKAAGMGKHARLTKAVADAEKSPSEGKWRIVAEELRGAWAKELPERLKPGASLTPFEIDRAARLLPLYDTEGPGTPESGKNLRNPMLPVLREQRQSLAQLTARRYESEKMFLQTLAVTQRPFGKFYQQAAEDVRIAP